jgi:hypothetical protein
MDNASDIQIELDPSKAMVISKKKKKKNRFYIFEFCIQFSR